MNRKNDFKAFSISNNANVVSQEGYEESPSLRRGFPPDNITVHLLNKVLRQSSTITSVVANFIATYSNDDVLDDGDIAKLTAQLNKALEQKISNISNIPVGIPVPWPTAIPPEGWIQCNGAVFDKSKFPKLAEAYPNGRLPDLRGEFIRGWDERRGVDNGRKLLSWQEGSALGQYPGDFDAGVAQNIHQRDGITYHDPKQNRYKISSLNSIGTGVDYIRLRPRNIAFNYIVKAE
ncbi:MULTISPECIES: phage tail protein [Photorhabdus]|uniref:Tail fiber protein n=2 Tax=Photorhabdus asymbiotica TaxID=291112 RepID=C7BIE0_PHOAA|nr:phage tail protein [Photorhabdus asymbiotica]RKS66025.1 tail collar domain [Photorhabdus asymbiotica]CAQ84078.1 putative tail fiber protein [Photorhabdus asymbiotica]